MEQMKPLKASAQFRKMIIKHGLWGSRPLFENFKLTTSDFMKSSLKLQSLQATKPFHNSRTQLKLCGSLFCLLVSAFPRLGELSRHGEMINECFPPDHIKYANCKVKKSLKGFRHLCGFHFRLPTLMFVDQFALKRNKVSFKL